MSRQKQSMSDNGPEESRWRIYVQDMVSFGATIQMYTAGLNQGEFVADGRTL